MRPPSALSPPSSRSFLNFSFFLALTIALLTGPSLHEPVVALSALTRTQQRLSGGRRLESALSAEAWARPPVFDERREEGLAGVSASSWWIVFRSREREDSSTRVFGRAEKIRTPLRRLPRTPFTPSLPGFSHPNPLDLLSDGKETATGDKAEGGDSLLPLAPRLGPVPRSVQAGFAYAQRLLRGTPQGPKRRALPLLDLVLKHTTESTYYFEEFPEHKHLSAPASEADLAQSAALRETSRLVQVLERLRFPKLIRLRPCEMTESLRRGCKLLFPGGAAAAEAALRVLLEEQRWSVDACRRWFLADPKEFVSPLAPQASATEAKFAVRSIEEAALALRAEADRRKKAAASDEDSHSETKAEAACLAAEAEASARKAEKELREAKTLLADFCAEREASARERTEQQPPSQSDESCAGETQAFLRLAEIAAAAKMRSRLRRWRELGFSSKKVEGLALKRPQLLEQQRPSAKLEHVVRAFSQVQASKALCWGEGDADFSVPDDVSDEAALRAAATAQLERWERAYDEEQRQWLDWWKHTPNPQVLRERPPPPSLVDAQGGISRPGAPELVLDAASRGLFQREVVPGEEGAEREAAERGGDCEEARQEARRQWRGFERRQSALFKALEEVRAQRIRDLVRRYPRVISFNVEGRLKAKLLYLQNCMYTSLHEVLRFPQALTMCLYSRIMPRHIALVNEFLIRVHAARFHSEETLVSEEDEALDSQVPGRRPRLAEAIDDGAEAEVYREFCRIREHFDFKQKLLRAQPRSVARWRTHCLLFEQEQRKIKRAAAAEAFQGLTERCINKGPLDSVHDLLVLPPLHPLRGWRGLAVHHPIWSVPLPPLEEMLVASDEAFCEAFSIPRRRFLEAKKDAESVPNPRRLF